MNLLNIGMSLGIIFAIGYVSIITAELTIVPLRKSRFIGSNIEFGGFSLDDTVMYAPTYRPDTMGFGGLAAKYFNIAGEEGMVGLLSAETLHPVLEWKVGASLASGAIDRLNLHDPTYRVGNHGLADSRLDWLIFFYGECKRGESNVRLA